MFTIEIELFIHYRTQSKRANHMLLKKKKKIHRIVDMSTTRNKVI